MNDEVVNSCTLRNSQGGNTCKPALPLCRFNQNILLSLECFIFVLFFNIYFIIFFSGGGGGGEKGLIKLLSNSHLHHTILS